MSRRITAGNDAPFRWAVKLQGKPFDLSGKDVKVYVINSRGEIPVARLTIEGHEVSGVFEGRYQTRLGEHSLVLRVNEGRPEMKTATVANVFELVQWSADAGGSDEGDVIVAPVLIESELSIGVIDLSDYLTKSDAEKTYQPKENIYYLDWDSASGSGELDEATYQAIMAADQVCLKDGKTITEPTTKVKNDAECAYGFVADKRYVLVVSESNYAIIPTPYYDDKGIKSELTELSAEVGKKQDVLVSSQTIKTINGESILGSGNIIIQGGGGNEEMPRILAGNSPNLIWEDLEGKIHFEGGYITSRKAQSDTYFRTNCKKILSCTVNPTIAEWAFLFGEQTEKGVIEEVYPYIFSSAKLTSLNFAFSGAPNIKDWSFLKYLDTSKITSMSGVFHASEADTIDLSNWDVSNVTNLGNNSSYNFFGNIKKVLGLENWDISNVQQMKAFLSGGVEEFVGVENWDVQNCNDFERLFYSTSASSIDVSLWRISDGANMNDFIKNGGIVTSFGMPNVPTGAKTSHFGRYLDKLTDITMREDALIYASLYFNESPLTADSVKTLLSHLADTPDEGATITFKSGLYTGYSAEDKAEIDALRNTATTNGWTIVNMG